uniref:Uncharacterized protein n=1 Tax=viral metagenome TaxID=1070528 RepID=A0A6C0LVX3_9ZZZZ
MKNIFTLSVIIQKMNSLVKYSKKLHPVWTLTWQHCKNPTLFNTKNIQEEYLKENSDIGFKCLKELGNIDLKPIYDYLKTEIAELTNIIYYCRDHTGYKICIYSSESASIGYLLSIMRHHKWKRCT